MNIQNSKNTQTNYSPNVLIIFYDLKEPLLKAINDYNASIIYDLKIMKSITIKIPENKKLKMLLNFSKKLKELMELREIQKCNYFNLIC